MVKSSLRTKMLLSVGLIIFVVLGTSTLVHIQDLRRDYVEAIEWRAEGLAHNLFKVFMDEGKIGLEIQQMSALLSLRSADIFNFYKEKHVTHVAVIDDAGTIIAHNNAELLNTAVESPVLFDYLRRHEQMTVSDGTVYHTLIPIFGPEDDYVGSIDIGFPKSVVDKKVKEVLIQSAGLFGLFLFLSFLTVFIFMHFFLTKPVSRLVTVGQRLAEGDLVQTFQTTGRRDEIAILGTAFNRIAGYLQNIAEVASQIATGVLAGKVRVRSERDVLGKAVYEMLHYLKHVAAVAAKITEGDLTGNVQVRSSDDAFGQVIQAMTEGLRTLIVQIRASAEQIASTGTTISSLAVRDISIVHDVHDSAEQMMATMTEMGASVEEVAHNMETLSSSVEETSASISQMTASIAHIASNTTELTQQSHQTIEFLDDTVKSLEEIVKSTDESKHLSQEAIQNALEGQQAVEQVMTSMATIQQTMTTAVEAITKFAQRSQEIDTILDVIRDITEQTSLLALNASIIAAQAGMHGRGFAVVADEIKNLASGVTTSTKDIAAIVQSLQQDTNKVVQSVHEGAADVKQGIERTQQAQEALHKIITSAQQSSSVITEIADALHGLMTTSRDVSTAMEQVNTMTDDITASTREQEATTKQINQAIGHINDMASQIQRATSQQLNGVQQVLDATNTVTTLINQNLESSQQIAHTTEELSSQAGILLQSVDRFKLSS
jgi:methyl-accepting chemotaxis protein